MGINFFGPKIRKEEEKAMEQNRQCGLVAVMPWLASRADDSPMTSPKLTF
jgi:hypothetical protein